MRVLGATVEAKRAVSSFEQSGDPQPTSVCHLHLLHKALVIRFHKTIIPLANVR